MSLVETLHQARKARLQRIAARAVVQAEMERESVRPALPAAPRHRRDRDYERAWAREILGLVEAPDRPARRPRVEDIQRLVAQHLGLRPGDIVGSQRSRPAHRARQVAMYLARELTTKSFPEIGRCFGNRDHTTVLRAAHRIGGLLARDAELAAAVDRVRAALDDPDNCF
jgi:chromosomal replication initiation ATPase DnaA